MIDEKIIRETFALDAERGFKLLMVAYQQSIYNYIRRLVVSHDDAEDVLQEVFIRVYRHWGSSGRIVRCLPGYIALPQTRVCVG